MKYREIDYENFEITPEFARLHAHICGDGCLFKVKTNRSKKELLQHPRNNTVRNRFHLSYCNTNSILIELFIKDLKLAFNRVGVFVPSQNHVDVQAKWLYDLFKFFGAGKSKEWFIPNKIMYSSLEIKAQWLKAFFDDEAYVSNVQKRIVLNVVNHNGLKQIQNLLFDLGIISRLNGPYRCREFYSYHLTIYKNSLERFSNTVGFDHPEKKRKLREIIKVGT